MKPTPHGSRLNAKTEAAATSPKSARGMSCHPRNQSVVDTVQVEASKRFAILQQAWQRAVSGEHYGGATFAIGIAVNISMVVTESAYFARYSTRENDGE